MDLVWQKHPGHPTLRCASAAHGTYWGSKTSLIRVRRLLWESAFASLPSSTSWFTRRDTVSESNRKLKSLHSTWKKTKCQECDYTEIEWKQNCDCRDSHWWGHTYHFGFEPRRPRVAEYNQQPKRKGRKDLVQVSINTKPKSTIIYAFSIDRKTNQRSEENQQQNLSWI